MLLCSSVAGDRRCRHRLHRHGPQPAGHRFTTENFARLSGDRRLLGVMQRPSSTSSARWPSSMSATGWSCRCPRRHCRSAPAPSSAPSGFPRMSPSVVYALLWSWVVAPPTRPAQPNARWNWPGAGRHEERRADDPDCARQRFHRSIVRHDHLHGAIRSIPEHLFHAARVDGAGELSIVRHVTLPAIRWQVSFVTLYQALSLLVSFEYIWLITDGGPFFDTTVWALYVYQRAFDNGQYAYGAALSLASSSSASRGAAPLALFRYACAPPEAADRGVMSVPRPRSQVPPASGSDLVVRRGAAADEEPAPVRFLVLGSLPILVPYLWLVTVAFSGRTGASTFVLWRTSPCSFPRSSLVAPAPHLRAEPLAAYHRDRARGRRRHPPRHLYRVLSAPRQLALPVEPGYCRHAQGSIRRRGEVPERVGRFRQFAISCLGPDADRGQRRHTCRLLPLALRFQGRAGYLKGLLVLHAFPAMTLIIPIFLMMYWIGLLDTIAGVILISPRSSCPSPSS